MTAPTDTTPAASTAVTKRAWGADFAARLLGDGGAPSKPAVSSSAAMTYGRAFGFAAFDCLEVGVLGLFAGAAHRRGLLNPGVSGIVGLLALAASAPASVHSPLAGRALGNVGLAGIFAAAFAAGGGATDAEPSAQVEDIADVERDL